MFSDDPWNPTITAAAAEVLQSLDSSVLSVYNMSAKAIERDAPYTLVRYRQQSGRLFFCFSSVKKKRKREVPPVGLDSALLRFDLAHSCSLIQVNSDEGGPMYSGAFRGYGIGVNIKAARLLVHITKTFIVYGDGVGGR